MYRGGEIGACGNGVATEKFIPVVHAQVGRAVPMTARVDGLFTASMHLPVDCHIEYKVASGPYYL